MSPSAKARWLEAWPGVSMVSNVQPSPAIISPSESLRSGRKPASAAPSLPSLPGSARPSTGTPPERPGQRMRQRAVIGVGVCDEDRGHPLALERAEDRRQVRRIVRPRIDHGHLAPPDDEAVGAEVGEGPGIAADHPAQARRDLHRLAVARVHLADVGDPRGRRAAPVLRGGGRIVRRSPAVGRHAVPIPPPAGAGRRGAARCRWPAPRPLRLRPRLTACAGRWPRARSPRKGRSRRPPPARSASRAACRPPPVPGPR